MGPLQNLPSKERVAGVIEQGVKEGAKLSLDGRKLNLVGDVPEGCFLNPTVFEKRNTRYEPGEGRNFWTCGKHIKGKGIWMKQ